MNNFYVSFSSPFIRNEQLEWCQVKRLNIYTSNRSTKLAGSACPPLLMGRLDERETTVVVVTVNAVNHVVNSAITTVL